MNLTTEILSLSVNLDEPAINTIPFVSIIMPVFNAELYLPESIESILNQTYSNFEFLIFNDGSTDNSLEIIKSYNDPRIKLFSSPVNTGLVIYLNKGIDLARGKYIARMDADDISLPNRLEEQIEFLENNPEIGVCGSKVAFFGLKQFVTGTISNHEELIVQLLFYPPFIHPSVMIQKSVLKDFNIKYKEEYLYVEDYEIWVQLAKVTKFAIIPKLLFKYRTHDLSVNATKWKSNQYELIQKIRKNQFEAFIERKLSTIEISFICENLNININNLFHIFLLFREIKAKNKLKRTYNSKLLNHFLNERILGAISRNRRINFQYFSGICFFPFLFASVFFQNRIYIRTFQKFKVLFNPILAINEK